MVVEWAGWGGVVGGGSEGVYSAARHGEIVLTGERGRIGERGDGEEKEEEEGERGRSEWRREGGCCELEKARKKEDKKERKKERRVWAEGWVQGCLMMIELVFLMDVN